MLLIVIGLLHTKMIVSPDGFGKQFMNFSQTYFFNISAGLAELPVVPGKTDLETAAVFWCFYFGIFLIPLGLLVHSVEKSGKALPSSFTISYLLFVLLGCYMIPNSGMTFIMLPHAIYMLIINSLRVRKHMVSSE